MTELGDDGTRQPPSGASAPRGWSAPGAAPPAPPVHAAPTGPATTPSPAGTQASYAPAGHAAYGPTPAGYPPQHWSTALTAHKPGIVPLRPLGLGDIIEGSFAAMRRNPRTFFGLALLTSLAILLFIGAVAAVGYLAATSFATSEASDAIFAVGALGGITILYVVSAVTTVVLTGMLSYPVGEAVLGRKPSVGETWRRTRGMLLRLTGLCLILVIPVVVVLGALIALSIWAFDSGSNGLGAVGVAAVVGTLVATAFVGVRLALATPALVLEDCGVIASLRRSWHLTAGRFWRTLGVLFVSYLVVGLVQQVLAFGFQLLGMLLGFVFVSVFSADSDGAGFIIVVMTVTVGGSLLASLVSQPFLAAVGALLYTDSRIRKEGFDLALVRAATGAQVPA